MKSPLACLVIILALEFCLPANAGQEPLYTLQRIDSRYGLSNSSVNAICQGADKMLWVGTWDGLNSFNGSSFTAFNYNQSPIRGLKNNVIEDIVEDADHNIWIATVEGISSYKPTTGEFTHYFYATDNKHISEKQFILFTDNNKQPYVYSPSSGLQKFDTKLRSFVQLVFTLPNKNIKQFIFSNDGRLWALSHEGQLTSFTLQQDNWKQEADTNELNSINSIHKVNGSLLIAFKDGTIAEINGRERKTLTRLPAAVKLIVPYEDHYIIAWQQKGCAVLDKNFKPSPLLKQEIAALQELQINTIHAGSDKIIWLGTDGSGIAKISPIRKSFTLITNTGIGLKNDKQVRTFERVNNELWVGTKGNGIVVMPYTSVQPTNVRIYNESSGLSNNAVYAIKKINERWVYIGSDGDGLLLYDQIRRKFIQWSQVKGTAPLFRSVYAILPDSDGSVWLGTSGYGLIHLKIEGADQPTLTFFKQYKSTGNDHTGPASDIIFSLTKDHIGRIWMACRYAGVSILNKQTEEFSCIRSGATENSLSHNDVLCVLADSKQQIWIGTSFGLNRIGPDFDPNKIQRYSTTEALPNNTIHGITEDNHGMIWISTNNGLARINGNDIMRFRETDGLQSNEFSDGAVWKSNDGRLFFGGIYGFNFVEPSNITANSIQPNLQISNLKLGGKLQAEGGYTILTPHGQNNPTEYTVSRSNNYFDLVLNAIDFINQSKSEFAYRLDGFDKNWHYPGASGYISYGNLPPGDYVLRVRWSNGEGQWTTEETLLLLTVEQYLWLTPAAFLLYYVIAVILIYAIYTYRKSKTEIKHKLELEYQLRLKEEKLHQEKLEFFTNIAHELQTPLTLIMGSVEHQQQQPDHDAVETFALVHQQASRLAYLIEQLMEFRKVEEGHLKPELQPMNASDFFSSIARLFTHFREYSSVSYSYEIEDGIKMDGDPDKLEKIVFNLLSNAFKYTSRGEKIHFRVYRNTEKSSLEISVANSGHDISPSDMDKLFDRFFTGNRPRKFSSGLGLAFTKQLVNLLGGRIRGYCKNNWACFEVSFPLNRTAQVKESSITPLQPSLLIRTIAKGTLSKDAVSAAANNKSTLLQSLEQDDRPIILVVEDDAIIRQLIRKLIGERYLIYEACNGKEALACMTRIIPHLIITDIMMEDMDGLELCQKVKSIPDTCHIPVLMLSARGTKEQQHEGYESGADAYLPKPFHQEHLLGRIEQLLQSRHRLHDYFRNKIKPDLEAPNGMNEVDRQFMEVLVKKILTDLDNPELDASHLEAAMAMSRMQLYRKIKTISGMTPAEFIRNLRLQKAAELLETTQLTVSEIFFKTGFNNQSYFFREFKKKYHCSPNEFRTKHQSRHKLTQL